MKIDFYISSLSGGGAEKVLISISQKLASVGHNVSIISLEKRPQFYNVDENVQLVKYETEKTGIKGLYDDYKNIKTHLKKSKADVSVCFLLRCNLLVLLAGMFYKSRIIVSDRNNPLMEHSKAAFLIQNLLYLRANKVIVQTEQIKGYYTKAIQRKICVIENPIDTKALDAQISEMPEREKIIISIGRLEAQKDYKTLIDAFERVHKKYPEWKVNVYGKGDMKEELEAYVESKALSDSFVFCGRTSKPYYELRKASIFVLSSFYEGFPNVLCEAMYAGDLCISSDCVSGPRELINHGKNGWLFPVEDVEKLSNLLEECIVNETELLPVRDAAEKTVQRLFLDNNIEKWKSVIE